MSLWGSNAILAFRDPTLPAIIVDTTGRILKTFKLNQHESVASAVRSDSSLWTTLTVIGVDDELLATLADFKSGTRMLIAFDSVGNFRRKTSFAGMVSLVASDEKQKRIVAVRRMNHSEVILYKWRWRNFSNRSE
ncbi:MAG: hypothetical protein ABJB74_03125 [Gemmatimonas sp.]